MSCGVTFWLRLVCGICDRSEILRLEDADFERDPDEVLAQHGWSGEPGFFRCKKCGGLVN
jgi:hypothetical protein